MRVLITGASGMLGAALVDKWKDKFDIFATGRKNFSGNRANFFKLYDFLGESYDNLMEWAEPDVIVHCAAITNVDYCQNNPDQAITVNAESVNKFLQSRVASRLIFISSDAVFSDGIHMASEKNKTEPENVYGTSKSIGEKYICDSGGHHVAIRTTIVGKNINFAYQSFVEWIINSVKDGKEITLFDDAIFTPITIWSLADELEWIIENDCSGIIHIAGTEAISKYDFGRKICDGLGLDSSLILSGSIDLVPFEAKRSKDQTLDSSYYQQLSGRTLPTTAETIDLIIQNFERYTYA